MVAPLIVTFTVLPSALSTTLILPLPFRSLPNEPVKSAAAAEILRAAVAIVINNLFIYY